MAQEEKLEEAKRLYKTANADQKYVLESLFPELKESEDERIRKKIIQLVNDAMATNAPYKKEMLAWLKKQCEHANFRNKIQIGDKVTRNEDGVLVNLSQLNRVAKKDEKQGEQKPTNNQFTTEQASVLDKHIDKFLEKKSAWSEKYIADVFEMVGLAKIVREQSNDSLTNALQDAMIELSKFLPQQKQEWSEEDEKMYNVVHDLAWEAYKTSRRLDIPTFGIINDWLKSLKPQNRWKPSERQKEALLWCVVHLGGADKQTLGELLEELNKL